MGILSKAVAAARQMLSLPDLMHQTGAAVRDLGDMVRAEAARNADLGDLVRAEAARNAGTRALAERIAAGQRTDDILLLLGQIAARLPAPSLQEAGFRVFSQNGEDGIIQHIVREVKPARSFIEFGVQSYAESNTRFLLLNDNWRGLVIDPDQAYIDHIKASPECLYKNDLTARRAFLTRDNINDVFREAGFTGELGLLSIDVDGMDWHLWDAVSVVDPAIVVIEYNRNLPVDRPIVVPYRESFDRLDGNHCYYGASLPAVRHLGRRKGYRYIGADRHRTNAFFVKEGLAGNALPEADITEADRRPATHDGIFSGLPFLDVVTGATVTL